MSTLVEVKPSATIRAASILAYGAGLGGAVPNVAILAYFLQHRGVPIELGIALDGGGPFDLVGTTAFAWLLDGRTKW